MTVQGRNRGERVESAIDVPASESSTARAGSALASGDGPGRAGPLGDALGASLDEARGLEVGDVDAPTAPQGGIARWRHALISFAITLVLLGVMAWRLDFQAVLAELARCNKTLALLALASHYATYPVRGIRWRLCLDHLPSHPGPHRYGLMVFYYNFVDNVVPGMLGQVYAAHLARINVGVSRAAALGSIVFLRMIDSWMVLGTAAVSSWILFSAQLPDSVIRAMTVGGAVAVLGSLVLLAFYWLHRLHSIGIPASFRRRIDSFRQGMWPARRHLSAIAFLTVVVWGLEATWMLALVASFDVHLGAAELFFLTMVPLLSSAFPLTPSGAGLVELTLFGCLRALGVGGVLAASITVLNRFIDYWLHILLGIVVWALRKRLGLRTWRGPDEASGEAPGEAPGEPGPELRPGGPVDWSPS